MLTDTTIIQRHGGCEVLAEPQEVTWPDRSALVLHLVRMNRVDVGFLRAVELPGYGWAVVDLRDLCPSLAEELPRALMRDVQGTVLYSLRQSFSDADTAAEAVIEQAKLNWYGAREAVAA